MSSLSDPKNYNYSAFRLALLIPFFNEEKRTDTASFTNFAKSYKDVLLILINDGSNDDTAGVLENIRIASPGNIEVLTLEKNYGKGNAIRLGMQIPINGNIPYTGYMDADLSLSFSEMIRLFHLFEGSEYDVVFGSRIKKLGSQIQRTFFRHLSGRIVATVLDTRFRIGCYDAQCGAKIFKTTSLAGVSQSPFYTRWFMDMEIILRMKKENTALSILETPLNNWEHKSGSKLKAHSVFGITKEIFILFSKY